MLQIWFHFGVTSTGEKAFEHRMTNYTALMVDQNRKPDLIILGTLIDYPTEVLQLTTLYL